MKTSVEAPGGFCERARNGMFSDPHISMTRSRMTRVSRESTAAGASCRKSISSTPFDRGELVEVAEDQRRHPRFGGEERFLFLGIPGHTATR